MGNEHSKSKEPNKNEQIPEKHGNGQVNGISAHTTLNGFDERKMDVKTETTVQQNGEPHSLVIMTESTDFVVIKSDCLTATVSSEVPKDTAAITSNTSNTSSPISTTANSPSIPIKKAEAKKSKEEKTHLFGKVFKKKAEAKADVKNVEEKEKEEERSEDQADVSLPPSDPPQETANPKNQESEESLAEPESATPESSRTEEDKVPETESGDCQPAEDRSEENPVMNFFKTLVTTTKTSKKETPDATKDQPLKEAQPAAATSPAAPAFEPPAAPKGMSVPPPPPPEPPKLETKAEAAAKPVKPAPKEEPKAAAKEAESSKGKSAKDALSKLFRPKKVDPSKSGTLEAAAKPEPPPPVQEEKKPATKSSFLSIFKPKVLLDHMTTKVQAASTSGVRLLRKTTGLAAEAKKATPAPPAAAAAAAAAEAAPAVKAKEETKAAAKSTEVAADSKPAAAASQAADDAANLPKRLEKRNSIQLFFKNLGQKRHSTDAGVQTEPAIAAAAAEKAK
ncbi:breast carcinoma-amplified sequence 1 isoform X9 [Parambassis ranga]|uniref:Breast carcinoma-amplified sequence 1 isoform X9 n=1 Tax=Parambassis ranga TaxID=210632 RepID=A0A6P7ICW7_9TELE|nr:nucleolar protein dao-5-like isoform X9 [Parambassis ranga]